MGNIISTSVLSQEQKLALLHLWNSEYPAQLAHADINSLNNYLYPLQNVTHYFLMVNEEVTAWAETFTRDGERWFAIITARAMQGKGYGKKMLELLMEKEPILNGWATDHNRYTKADGSPYPSPLEFYVKLGFTITDIRLETDKLSSVKIVWVR